MVEIFIEQCVVVPHLRNFRLGGVFVFFWLKQAPKAFTEGKTQISSKNYLNMLLCGATVSFKVYILYLMLWCYKQKYVLRYTNLEACRANCVIT